MGTVRFLTYLFILIFFLQCKTEQKQDESQIQQLKSESPKDSIINKKTTIAIVKINCDWDKYFKENGLVNIQEIDSSLQVELKYSTTDNFMHKDVYGCLNKCYLQPDVAEKLSNAQLLLKEINPKLSLLIYDGVRPRSIQQYMWDILDMPINDKVKFVSNPAKGSLHNFGAAVDITLYNLDSLKPLDMGTPYDYIGLEAWPTKEKLMLENGILTEKQIENRKLLRKVMIKANFFNIQTEWWHFNSCYRNEAKKLYTIMEGIEIK